MYGKEYLENKEITETVDAIETAITEILEQHPSELRDSIEAKIRNKRTQHDLLVEQSWLARAAASSDQYNQLRMAAPLDSPFKHGGIFGFGG